MKTRVVLLIMILAWSFTGCTKKEEKKRDANQFQVERGDIEKFVEAVGVIVPTYTVEVKSKASGEVVSMPFEEGQWVNKGDLLVQLDPVDELRNLRRQQAQLNNASANLEQTKIAHQKALKTMELKRREIDSKEKRSRSEFQTAKANYERALELHRKKLNPDQTLEEAQNRLKVAEVSLELVLNEKAMLALNEFDIASSMQSIRLQESRIEQEEVNLEIAQIRLEETKIQSPIRGLILKRLVEPGQIISSGISNVSGGTTLMMLADVEELFLDTQVDESDISRIKLDQEVELRIEAWPRKTFKGRVRRIAPQGEDVSNVTIFRVQIALDKRANRFVKPGMNATAKIVFQRETDILKVPLKALTRRGRDFGVLKGESVQSSQFATITVGIRDSSHAQVSGPLQEGQILWEDTSRAAKSGGDRQAARNMRRGMRMMNRGSR